MYMLFLLCVELLSYAQLLCRMDTAQRTLGWQATGKLRTPFFFQMSFAQLGHVTHYVREANFLRAPWQ